MSSLGGTLSIMRTVCTLAGLNIHQFDEERRTFRRIKCYASCVRLCQGALLAPYLYFTYKSLMILKFYLLSLIKVDLQGEEGLQMFYKISRFLVLARVIYLHLRISYHYTFGLKKVEKLLRDFVRTYDKYVELSGATLEIQWDTLRSVCLKMVVYELYQWKCQFEATDRLHLLYIPCSVQPLLITVLCYVALSILHGLYSGTQSMLQALTQPQHLPIARLEQLLQFYEQLMALRRDFQACTNVIFGIEYFENLNHLTMAVHGPAVGMSLVESSLKGCFYMIFPMCFTRMTCDMCSVQQTLGHEMFALNDEDVGDRVEKFQLLESFIWRKHIRDQYFAPSFGLLQSDRSSIFDALDFAFINGMMLNGLFLVTTSQALYVDKKSNSFNQLDVINLYSIQF